MANTAAAISICKIAKQFYNTLFTLKGLSYHNPFLDGMQKKIVHGQAAHFNQELNYAPQDIRVSCQTEEPLATKIGGLKPARLLTLGKLSSVVDLEDCDWACLDQIVASAQTTGDVEKLFDQMVLNEFILRIGTYFDNSVRELLLNDIPTSIGTKITPAEDGIKTLTIDTLDTLEAGLRTAITHNMMSGLLNDPLGKIIIYGDNDLQALLENALVMGYNVFGGCCRSEFASNITKCNGSMGHDTVAYTVPITKLPTGENFFSDDGTYRTYFVAASGRGIFGYNPNFVEAKLRDPCATPMPYTSQFMEQFIDCDYLPAYQRILDEIDGKSWFFLKRNRNPVHKKHVMEEYQMGAMTGMSRSKDFGFLLKIKKTLFGQFLKNSQISAGTLPVSGAPATHTDTVSADYVNDTDPKNKKVKPSNKGA